ncbi:MAG: carbohydrate binding family 9 domain-containing protein [Gemmatimonadaceae bacterium]|nr:carbohydrate binding family 9 domain-containing protein [Gemmatimonadaceae bacterium]
MAQEKAAETPAAAARVPAAVASLRTTSVAIDGRITESAWLAAPVATGFIQRQPNEGRRAEHQTEVRILFDAEAMYIGARMHDPEPGRIARQMTRRDEEGQFDYFAVELDPDLDKRTGYRFRVSASNVQRDEYLFDDNERDAAWEAVWESAVSIDSSGWSAEIRIPLSQIRYRASEEPQRWGVNFFRRRLASNEESHFALISQLQRGHVSQYGQLDGVHIPSASRRLEMRPYVLSSGYRGPADPANPFSDGSDLNARAGIDVRYGLGGQFTLDATINPDFGQVESDPAVINLSAFETFLDERRPFFVEDAKIFDFTLSGGRNRIFYSRRIGRDPHGSGPSGADFRDIPDAAAILAAAKLTGRTNRGLSVGMLASVTRAEEGRAWFEDSATVSRFLVEPRTGFGVLRLRQDFNDGASTVGVIGSVLQRDLPSSGQFDVLPRAALAGGVDWEHQWGDRSWAFYGYVAGSHVRGDSTAMIRIQRSSVHYFQRPDSPRLTLDSSATSMSGFDWRMTLEKRRGDHWTGSIWAAQVSPGFEINDLGFSSRQEVLDGGVRVSYREITPGRIFRNYNISASTFHNYSHDLLEAPASRRQWALAHTSGAFSVNANAQLRNYWRLDGNLTVDPDRMDRSATRGGPLMLNPAAVNGRIGFDTDSRRTFTFGPNFSFERGTLGSDRRTSVSADIGFRPASWLDLRVTPDWSRSRTGAQYVGSTGNAPLAATYGRSYVFAELSRREFSFQTRANAAFNPRLSFQLYVQPLLSSGDYLTYKRFLEPATYRFESFHEGTYAEPGGEAGCTGGQTCVDADGTRHIDFDGDGAADYSFGDRDFNVRSLRGNAVLRWEYRPGSTLFLVWQRRQADESADGQFRFRRDLSAMMQAPAENVFMVKLRYWVGL